ncbi:MAG: FtsX-like permease family protein [Bacteroidetes bacterium]|nr:FtsX-like permease family protein [Bacteroidota bacterium]
MRLIFSLWEGSKLAFLAIFQNKMRSILTMFGIVIGIVSVTTMSTVIDGIDRGFSNSMKMLGQNVVYVEKWPWSFSPSYKWWLYINRPEMKREYAEQIVELSRYASAASATVGRQEKVRFEEKYINGVYIQGTTISYTQTSDVDISDGRFFTDEEDRLLRNVCVIGSDVAEQLFPNQYPLEKHIRFGGQTFLVVGVLAKQGNFLGLESFDNQILTPFSTYEKFFGARRGVQIAVKFPNEDALREGQFEIEGIMRRIRKLDPLAENNFAVNKLELFEQQYKTMTGAIYAIGIFLTGLSLFVGGIGVMNIMFVSVKERTKEIGIRKAIGAKSWEILLQFLVEAITVCGLGGVIGILFSLLASIAINKVFVAYMDWTTVLQALIITTIVGVGFGYFPARKAAKSDPISSLRYE